VTSASRFLTAFPIVCFLYRTGSGLRRFFTFCVAKEAVMSSAEVRPFRRSDREQVTALVNAHAGAVVPGMSVSASTVLSALEREPGEFITDPWVSERVTLVAVLGERIAAAAHLLRYHADDRAGPDLRAPGRSAGSSSGPRRHREPLLARCDRGRGGTDRRQHPSSGRTSARCTSGPVSATPGTPRPSTWPGSATCRTQPGHPSPACPSAARPG
jgi:hypothetical protein